MITAIKIQKVLLVWLLFLLFTVNSNAQWIFQTKENAFEPEKSLHLALTVATGGYAFGLRCEGGEPSVVFLTPETSENVDALNIAEPKLLLKIDSGDIQEMPAELYVANGNIAALAADNNEDILGIFDEGRNAKSRISVAIKILGQTLHPTNFGVRGSTNSISKLQNECNGFNDG